MYRYSKYFLLATVLASVGTLAYAARDTKNDAIAIEKAPISLLQAVTNAELHAHGRASRAEYEPAASGSVYDIEIVSAGKVFDVRVDADKGIIISSKEDSVDHDDEHDAKD